MTNIDVDSDPTTFNSSSNDAVLPAGHHRAVRRPVLGGARTGASGGVTTTAPIGQMLLKAPGDVAYRTIATQQQYGPTSGDEAYQQFADVTSDRAVGGGGHVLGGQRGRRDRRGPLRRAGRWWSPTATRPSRCGTSPCSTGSPTWASTAPRSIPISGFLAPLTGPVDARLGIVAYEGDHGGTGDSAFLNQTRLATALSTGHELLQRLGRPRRRQRPHQEPRRRQHARVRHHAPRRPRRAIPNGARSATVTLSTTSERYFIGARHHADQPLRARLHAEPQGGGEPERPRSRPRPGDTLEYTLSYVNAGQDPAGGTIAVDPLPPGTTFVPGSLEVVTGPNAGVEDRCRR